MDFTDDVIQRWVVRNGPTVITIAVPKTKNPQGKEIEDPKFTMHKGPWEGPLGPVANHAVLVVGWDENYWCTYFLILDFLDKYRI